MSIINFSDLKKAGSAEIERLNEEASKFKSGGFAKDERYWTPELDKAGEGGAIIRFMPAPRGERVPFVRKYSYGFKGPTGKWFIENSPQTLGLPCPVMEFNSELWDSGSEEKKDQARRQKRRLSFITNIMVIRHKARPADEGKVFLYEFGKKIWDKLQDKMNPDDEDKRKMNPFDLWEGANFRLKIAQVSGFRNYDKSEFDEPGPLHKDDAELERIWEQCYSLQGEISPDKFKSYDALKAKLNQTLGLTGRAVSQMEESEGRVDNKSDDDGNPPWESEDADMKWLQDLANK